MTLSTTLKPKNCPVCERRFMPARPLQALCGQRCATKVAKQQMADRKAKERALTKERRTALETIPQLIAVADKAFAAYIRERDRQAGYPCISSGKPLDWSGNKVDAGHYRSRGAASHLRYDEDNCHAQSKQDNQWKAGNVVEYRIRLVQRIGLERVEALECCNAVAHWTKEGLRGIAATYKAKLKELKCAA